jgi:Zn-dependent protease
LFSTTTFVGLANEMYNFENMLLKLLFTDPQIFILLSFALIISISIHEFSHAFMADKLGDSTARDMGRLTINPKAHLDPMGTLLLVFIGFGWGKPVPFNPFNLKNPKRDAALISLAGPVSNLLLATLLAFVLRVVPMGEMFSMFFYFLILYNLMLGFFNLIPLGPLDGNKIVFGFLPNKLAIQWAELQRYSMFMLIFLLLTNFTDKIIGPLVDFAIKILLG